MPSVPRQPTTIAATRYIRSSLPATAMQPPPAQQAATSRPSAAQRPAGRAPLSSRATQLNQPSAAAPTTSKGASRKRDRSRNSGPPPAARQPADKQPKNAGMITVPTSRAPITVSMLPSENWWISEGEVNFQKGGYRSSCPALLPCEKLLTRKQLAHPVRPTLIVDSMEDTTLPEPAEDMTDNLRNNPWLFLKPKVVRCNHYKLSGIECSCVAMGLMGQFHRPSVLPDVCLKNQFLKPSEFAITPRIDCQTLENPSRFYICVTSRQDLVLGVPTPFPVSGPWVSRAYEPAMACVPRQADRLKLFYTLYNSQRFREIGQTYLQEPDKWSFQEHPTFREPCHGTELGAVCSNLYGVETLQRVGLCSHPLAEPKVNLYLAVSPVDRKVPVYVTDRNRPLQLDVIIANILRPWYELGHGKILCPVCLVQTDPVKGPQLMFLTRSDYMCHWELNHAPDLVATSTFSATQLNTRIHMGHVAFVLAATHCKSGHDTPSESALCRDAMQSCCFTEYSDVLVRYLGPSMEEDLEALCENMLGQGNDAPSL